MDVEKEFYERFPKVVLNRKTGYKKSAHIPLDDTDEPTPACHLNQFSENEWQYKRIPDDVPPGYYRVCNFCLYKSGLIDEHPAVEK